MLQTFQTLSDKNMKIRRLIFALILCLSIFVWLPTRHHGLATANGQEARLLRRPAVSRDSVAFEYAGDLWVVARSGGQARRLTATPGVETDPYFSPDSS